MKERRTVKKINENINKTKKIMEKIGVRFRREKVEK